MAKLNFENSNKKRHLSKNGSLKSRKSERKPLVNDPTKSPYQKCRPKKKVKQVSVSYTLKNGVMPYGKFKNWKISDLPTDYIKWAILNLNENEHSVANTVLEALANEMVKRDPTLA
jgi:hypothetical protein